MLVKALPHAGPKHGETVCCAGLTPNGEWRRQFPIAFRRLKEKFKRWDIIEYEYIIPKDDRRRESRRVQEDTIKVLGSISQPERTTLLNRVIVSSTSAAEQNGQSLALIRPRAVKFKSRKKSISDLTNEKKAYQEAARQQSFFDKDLLELEPCPYAFEFVYSDDDGFKHTSTCDDWETATMYWRFSKELGEQPALSQMKTTFERDYPLKGMAFALGTHSRYPSTWLLVGVLRLDESKQISLAI